MSPTHERHVVLIVDDDADIRDSLAEACSDAGFDVRTATNGLEALQVLRSDTQPCMILLDLMMPVMDGYGFFEARRENEAFRAVPVTLITASAQLDRSRLDGVPVLPKPIMLAKLLDVVAHSC